MAKLYYFYGAMGSAKTLRLLSTAYNFDEKGIHCICLKPSIDNRDGIGIIHSRAGLQRQCQVIEPTANLFDLIYNAKSKDELLQKVIIDECQFLTSEQVNQLGGIVDRLDIDVMCYGLRTDFRTKTFEGSLRLFELADTIEEVKSHCSCGRKAIMNARFDSTNNIITEGSQVQIGGNESYKPLCRKCYFEAIEVKTHQDYKKIIKEVKEQLNKE